MDAWSQVIVLYTNKAVSSREWKPRTPEVENLVWQYSCSLPTGLVEVSFPCWCMRKCRVTVPWAASASTVFPSGQTSTLVIIPSEPNPTNHKGAFVQTVKPKSQKNCSSAIKTGVDYRRKFMSLPISLRPSSPKFCFRFVYGCKSLTTRYMLISLRDTLTQLWYRLCMSF